MTKVVNRTLDPNNITNPGKQLIDHAYEKAMPDVRSYVQREQEPPPARPVADGVVTRIADVYEFDPRLTGTHFNQQDMPTWDTERLVASRQDHLAPMRRHSTDEALYDGSPSALDHELA